MSDDNLNSCPTDQSSYIEFVTETKIRMSYLVESLSIIGSGFEKMKVKTSAIEKDIHTLQRSLDEANVNRINAFELGIRLAEIEQKIAALDEFRKNIESLTKRSDTIVSFLSDSNIHTLNDIIKDKRDNKASFQVLKVAIISSIVTGVLSAILTYFTK